MGLAPNRSENYTKQLLWETPLEGKREARKGIVGYRKKILLQRAGGIAGCTLRLGAELVCPVDAALGTDVCGRARRIARIANFIGLGQFDIDLTFLVANALQITEQTVKEHIKHIMRKTNSTTRTGILVQIFNS